MKHLHAIRRQIERSGSQAALATRLNVSQGYLSDVMSRKRAIGLALALKLERRCGVNGLRLLTQQVEQQWLEFQKSSKEEDSK